MLIELQNTQNISPHNSSETVTNEYHEEIPKERYTSPEERQKITDNLRTK